MGVIIFQVDAFTNKPFAGNPAGVCILSEHRDDSWMQNVAREMNLSETAFLNKSEDGFDLRWFTPSLEVDLCGHATLASAHILWENGIINQNEQARFHTRSGLLTAERKDEWIELDFPALPDKQVTVPKTLSKILGAKPRYVGKSRMDYIVEVDSEKTVRKMTPNASQLAELPFRGLIVTAPAASKPYDFVSRFFAPRVGIYEDPVTGSAHCCLGPYWQKRLGKDEFLAQQVSARGGILRVRVWGKRVKISGEAVTVLRAELRE
ncbi:MAG: PhzF family phenazine biosynthesis protein [Candidatus Bathyarchaeia archaeon]|jgi:PhzF family phenazine biosynthesis protein